MGDEDKFCGGSERPRGEFQGRAERVRHAFIGPFDKIGEQLKRFVDLFYWKIWGRYKAISLL